MAPTRLNFEISDEMQELLDLVGRYLERDLLPVERDVLATGGHGIPKDRLKELQAKAREAGLWCFETPAEYGGCGLNHFQLALVREAACRHAFALPEPGDGAFGYDPPAILLKGTEEQKRRFIQPSVEEARQWFVGLSEPTGGSDPARAVQTKAELHGDTWVLNGRKLWMSEADLASHGILYCRTAPGRDGITAFIIDLPCPGFELRRIDVIRDHHTNEAAIVDVELPADRVLGEVGKGFSLAQDFLVLGRLRIAAQALGVAQAALDMAIEYAPQRVTFGKPLAARQMVQEMIVDSHVALQQARLLLWEAAVRADQGENPRTLASMAKLVCSETGFQVVDKVIQIFGGMGVSRELPLEHWLRALRVTRIVEGPSQVHKMVIARDLMGAVVNE